MILLLLLLMLSNCLPCFPVDTVSDTHMTRAKARGRTQPNFVRIPQELKLPDCMLRISELNSLFMTFPHKAAVNYAELEWGDDCDFKLPESSLNLQGYFFLTAHSHMPYNAEESKAVTHVSLYHAKVFWNERPTATDKTGMSKKRPQPPLNQPVPPAKKGKLDKYFKTVEKPADAGPNNPSADAPLPPENDTPAVSPDEEIEIVGVRPKIQKDSNLKSYFASKDSDHPPEPQDSEVESSYSQNLMKSNVFSNNQKPFVVVGSVFESCKRPKYIDIFYKTEYASSTRSWDYTPTMAANGIRSTDYSNQIMQPQLKIGNAKPADNQQFQYPIVTMLVYAPQQDSNDAFYQHVRDCIRKHFSYFDRHKYRLPPPLSLSDESVQHCMRAILRATVDVIAFAPNCETSRVPPIFFENNPANSAQTDAEKAANFRLNHLGSVPVLCLEKGAKFHDVPKDHVLQRCPIDDTFENILLQHDIPAPKGSFFLYSSHETPGAPNNCDGSLPFKGGYIHAATKVDSSVPIIDVRPVNNADSPRSNLVDGSECSDDGAPARDDTKEASSSGRGRSSSTDSAEASLSGVRFLSPASDRSIHSECATSDGDHTRHGFSDESVAEVVAPLDFGGSSPNEDAEQSQQRNWVADSGDEEERTGTSRFSNPLVPKSKVHGKTSVQYSKEKCSVEYAQIIKDLDDRAMEFKIYFEQQMDARGVYKKFRASGNRNADLDTKKILKESIYFTRFYHVNAGMHHLVKQQLEKHLPTIYKRVFGMPKSKKVDGKTPHDWLEFYRFLYVDVEKDDKAPKKGFFAMCLACNQALAPSRAPDGVPTKNLPALTYRVFHEGTKDFQRNIIDHFDTTTCKKRDRSSTHRESEAQVDQEYNAWADEAGMLRNRVLNSKEKITERLFRTVHTMIMNHVPLSNFAAFAELQELNGAQMGKMHLHYTGAKLMAVCMSKVYERMLLKHIGEDQPFSLLLDSSSDKKNRKILAVYVRVLSPGTFTPVTLLLKAFHVTESETGEHVSQLLFSYFESNGLVRPLVTNLVAFVSDGAGNMRGKQSGAQQKLRELLASARQDLGIPHRPLLFVWCAAHRLQLAMGDAFTSVLKSGSNAAYSRVLGFAKGLAKSLHIHYHKSSNHEGLQNACATTKTTCYSLGRLHDIRWVSSMRDVFENILIMWKAIGVQNEQVVREPPQPSASAARSSVYGPIFRNLKLYMFLAYHLQVLVIVSQASLSFQRAGASVLRTEDILEKMITDIDKFHADPFTGSEFKKYFDLLRCADAGRKASKKACADFRIHQGPQPTTTHLQITLAVRAKDGTVHEPDPKDDFKFDWHVGSTIYSRNKGHVRTTFNTLQKELGASSNPDHITHLSSKLASIQHIKDYFDLEKDFLYPFTTVRRVEDKYSHFAKTIIKTVKDRFAEDTVLRDDEIQVVSEDQQTILRAFQAYRPRLVMNPEEDIAENDAARRAVAQEYNLNGADVSKGHSMISELMTTWKLHVIHKDSFTRMREIADTDDFETFYNDAIVSLLQTKQHIPKDYLKMIHIINSVPLSTADVERGFSFVFKILEHDRMSTHIETLDKLLRIVTNSPHIKELPVRLFVEQWENDGHKLPNAYSRNDYADVSDSMKELADNLLPEPESLDTEDAQWTHKDIQAFSHAAAEYKAVKKQNRSKSRSEAILKIYIDHWGNSKNLPGTCFSDEDSDGE